MKRAMARQAETARERIIERHAGVLKFHTRLKQGTVFSILLPVTNE
jgi:signal transduction histidine kinase